MKKSKLLILAALFVAGSMFITACGNNRNDGTEAPYEDETNKDVNDTNNGADNNMYNDTNNGVNGTDNMYNDDNNDMDVTPGDANNGAMQDDMNDAGSNLEDAGRNLIDSIKDTGDAIRDGVDDLSDTNNNNRNNP